MRTAVRRVILGLLAVAIGIGIAFGVYGTSVQPGAAAVKTIFGIGSEVTPPAGFAAISAAVQETRGIAISASGAPTAHLNLYRPRGTATSLPVVLWIHGGGFISSSADTVRDYVILLAHEGYVVANLDYSLAPAARYPVPIVQANAALAYLRNAVSQFGGDPTRIFVGGDSAGAQIASQLGVVETDPSFAASVGVRPGVSADVLRGVILFCGLYDMRTVGATGFPALRTFLWSYTGSRDWTRYDRIDELSTTSTATADYPATFITVGDADPLRSQETELHRSLTRLGVPVTALTWTGSGARLGHEYQFDFSTSQARTAFADTLTFLADRASAP